VVNANHNRQKKKRAKPSSRSSGFLQPAFSMQVADAVQALRNNETRILSEVKSSSGKITMDTKVSYPTELVAAFRGLFGAGREYDFQMHYITTQTSDAGGGLLGSITINPSVTSFAEWTALSALFDEVKGISSECTFLTLNDSGTTGGAMADMVMAFDDIRVASSAPASTLTVYRLAESVTWVMDKGDAGSGKHRQLRKLTPRAYCATSTPFSVAPVGGLAGGWSFGNSGLFAVSTAVATVFIIVRARFRNRA